MMHQKVVLTVLHTPWAMWSMWKTVKTTLKCTNILQSRGEGTKYHWNWVDSGSQSATHVFVLVKKKKQTKIINGEQVEPIPLLSKNYFYCSLFEIDHFIMVTSEMLCLIFRQVHRQILQLNRPRYRLSENDLCKRRRKKIYKLPVTGLT